ncbi:Transposase [Flavobacterium branchiophilum]
MFFYSKKNEVQTILRHKNKEITKNRKRFRWLENDIVSKNHKIIIKLHYI